MVNLAGAPPGALRDVREAARRISGAGGPRLGVVGTTSSRARADWGLAHQRPGGARPTVLVAWVRPGVGGLGRDGSSGETITWSEDNGRGTLVYVGGEVLLNRDQEGLFKAGFGRGPRLSVLLEHELGHLVGLGHVNDPRAVMNPVLGDAADLAPGDLDGLRHLAWPSCSGRATAP